MSKVMVDPPGGWKYGFPKLMPESVENFYAWLVSEGYPRSEIDRLGDNFWCRQWEVEAETEEDDA